MRNYRITLDGLPPLEVPCVSRDDLVVRLVEAAVAAGIRLSGLAWTEPLSSSPGARPGTHRAACALCGELSDARPLLAAETWIRMHKCTAIKTTR